MMSHKFMGQGKSIFKNMSKSFSRNIENCSPVGATLVVARNANNNQNDPHANDIHANDIHENDIQNYTHAKYIHAKNIQKNNDRATNIDKKGQPQGIAPTERPGTASVSIIQMPIQPKCQSWHFG